MATPVTDRVTFDRATKTNHVEGPATIYRDADHLYVDIQEDGQTVSTAWEWEFLR